MSAAAVPAELVQKERGIAAAKAAESGKPANIVEKMVEGAVQKFLKEVTLLGQPFVKNDKQSIEQLLKSKGAAVAGFALYVVGEGLEKTQGRFRLRSDGASRPDRVSVPSRSAALSTPACPEAHMPQTPAYKRILLKLSGEALMGEDNYGINRETVDRIVGEIAEVVNLGVEVAVVIGGGNIFRGVTPAASHMDRATADYMGMLATVMNALALQDAMRRVEPGEPGPVRAQHRAGRRALHTGQGDALPGGGQGGHLRRRAPATRSSPPTRQRRCAAWR